MPLALVADSLGEGPAGGDAVITTNGMCENVWAVARSLCNELLDLDRRAARGGWGNLGATIADAAVEVQAEVSSGLDSTGSSPLRALSALRRAAEGLIRLQKLIRTAERSRHLAPEEADQLATRAKDVSGMLVALAVVMQAQGRGTRNEGRLWTVAA